jgi:hypothetical protein
LYFIQFLFGDSYHAQLLGNVLAQQLIVVSIAAAITDTIQISKVDLNARSLINVREVRKIFTSMALHSKYHFLLSVLAKSS